MNCYYAFKFIKLKSALIEILDLGYLPHTKIYVSAPSQNTFFTNYFQVHLLSKRCCTRLFLNYILACVAYHVMFNASAKILSIIASYLILPDLQILIRLGFPVSFDSNRDSTAELEPLLQKNYAIITQNLNDLDTQNAPSVAIIIKVSD